jgi:hypothetical protein
MGAMGDKAMSIINAIMDTSLLQMVLHMDVRLAGLLVLLALSTQ